jgi:hypothetical protein
MSVRERKLLSFNEFVTTRVASKGQYKNHTLLLELSLLFWDTKIHFQELIL